MLPKLYSPTMCHYRCSYLKKIVKTVNNVLEGHMLRKNPREQMTNKDIPHFFHTKTPNPNWKDGVTLTFFISR
jgi:hypothetical protein